MSIQFLRALGKDFFTSTLTSANWCSSQGGGLTSYLHLPWLWMGQCWAEFPVISTWVSQLALTCHGLLILQIAATRHATYWTFLQELYWYTNSPSLLRLYKSFIRPHLDYNIYCLESSSQEIESLEMYKSLPFKFVWNPGILNNIMVVLT